MFFFFSSRRRHTRWTGDWSSDVCSSDLSEWPWPCVEEPQATLRRMATATRTVTEICESAKRASHELAVASTEEIGRASCRERVEISGGAGSVKKKKGGGETMTGEERGRP